jgi:hypothetical protein
MEVSKCAVGELRGCRFSRITQGFHVLAELVLERRPHVDLVSVPNP